MHRSFLTCIHRHHRSCKSSRIQARSCNFRQCPTDGSATAFHYYWTPVWICFVRRGIEVVTIVRSEQHSTANWVFLTFAGWETVIVLGLGMTSEQPHPSPFRRPVMVVAGVADEVVPPLRQLEHNQPRPAILGIDIFSSTTNSGRSAIARSSLKYVHKQISRRPTGIIRQQLTD